MFIVHWLVYSFCMSFILPAGQFWQITDIHWDQQYSETGDPTKMCHDEYLGSDSHNGAYGNYLCDSPWKLVKSSIQAMTQIHPLPEFVLWTG